MAGGPTRARAQGEKPPANETALKERVEREARRRYGPRFYRVSTTRATPGRLGISDWLVCFDGHFLAWEFKHPTRPTPVKPRQRQELDAVAAAGGRADVITSVRQALDILESLAP